MAKNTNRTVDIDPVWSRFANSGEGHFEALVRLSSEDYEPDYMKIVGSFVPGVLKAHIPSHELGRLARDERVLSAEVREFVANC